MTKAGEGGALHFFPLCCFCFEGMEAWCNKLQLALVQGLEGDDEYNDFEDDSFFQMLGMVVNVLENDARGKVQAGESRIKRQFLYCDKEAFHAWLNINYFANYPIYGPVKFWSWRFRMRRELFLCIIDIFTAHNPWFMQRKDALERLGLSTLQKCMAAVRILTYDLPIDACDKYCRLSKSIASECMKRFVVAIVDCFKSTYLQQPT